jgi:hypothetical protein
MPLNRLHVRHIDYPNTKDAIAMVSKLEYAEKYDTALRYDNAFIAKACDILKCFMYIERQPGGGLYRADSVLIFPAATYIIFLQ